MIYDMIIYIINYKITFIIKFYVPNNFKLILSFLPFKRIRKHEKRKVKYSKVLKLYN